MIPSSYSLDCGLQTLLNLDSPEKVQNFLISSELGGIKCPLGLPFNGAINRGGRSLDRAWRKIDWFPS